MWMMFRKFLNRVRRRLAAMMNARPTLPTRGSHSAYPESQVSDDGSWVVRFYAYELTGWLYQGEVYAELPANLAEPELRHPTTYAEGLAPAENREAWRKYYADRPQPVTLVETLTGEARNRESAAKDAYRAMRGRINHYRRD